MDVTVGVRIVEPAAPRMLALVELLLVRECEGERAAALVVEVDASSSVSCLTRRDSGFNPPMEKLNELWRPRPLLLLVLLLGRACAAEGAVGVWIAWRGEDAAAATVEAEDDLGDAAEEARNVRSSSAEGASDEDTRIFKR